MPIRRSWLISGIPPPPEEMAWKGRERKEERSSCVDLAKSRIKCGWKQQGEEHCVCGADIYVKCVKGIWKSVAAEMYKRSIVR